MHPYPQRDTDISPLCELTQLIELSLSFNQIKDISPLSKLLKLTEVWLIENPLVNQTCPLQPENICKIAPDE
ncbi:MAG: leucine-rich repeat domain-containing protein [Symploca sp. SIO2D2]|nr:leucine-rich repeat domain-containing protein [Symploca sp. SIO2D2]NER20051.1 leucine-rich repeat domain-containing protein [Symploca sp. SIO1C2]